MSIENLAALKDDMVAFIAGHGIKRLPGYVTEEVPSIVWEDVENPDSWKDFVEMAKHAGAPFITFSEVKLDAEELDMLANDAREMNFPDDEAAELSEATWLRQFVGKIGYIQLGFVHQGMTILHETTTEWYERYQDLADDIEAFEELMLENEHGCGCDDCNCDGAGEEEEEQ